MLSVLGEGRGHMTQAMAVREMVEKAGHRVTNVVLGLGKNRAIPPFFASAMTMPIAQIPTLDFSYRNSRKVNLPATAASIVRRLPAYGRAIGTLKSAAREFQPDVIINFFEPVTGLVCADVSPPLPRWSPSPTST